MDRGSENKERRKYFFKPRIGSRYAEKWNGYRTMVLGAHQICTAKCEFLDLCCSNEGVWEMDNACPVYEDGRDDPYLRLSNGNRIEMDAYIEDAANYPAYFAFTKYILEEKGFVSPEKREYLTYRSHFSGLYNKKRAVECRSFFTFHLVCLYLSSLLNYYFKFIAFKTPLSTK